MFNLDDIKAVIPHRDPFLLIDEITEYIPMKSAVALKHITANEFYFKGHFPTKPVMPGVLMIESLAQVGAFIILNEPANQGKIAYFTGIQNAKFRRQVVPGDLLKLSCELTKVRGPFGFGLGKAYVGDELVCEAEISFAIQ